jgi:hypothetical protein
MEFNYYYGTQADQYTFLRIPKNIITDKTFVGLSLPAKLLYGLLLDRMSLSMKNKWLDDENRVYIIYQIKEIMNDLSLSEKMAIKHLKELEEFGLVEKRRRGFGLPSILYVKSFVVSDNNETDKYKQDETEDSEEETLDKIENEKGHIMPKNRPQTQETSRTVEMGRSRTVEMGSSRTVESGRSRTVEMGGSRTVDLGSSRAVEMGRSRTAEKEVQELPTGEALKNKTNMSNKYINNTKINNTDFNNNQSNHILETRGSESVQMDEEDDSNQDGSDEIRFEFDKKTETFGYQRIIKNNIEYDVLRNRYPHETDMIDGIVDIILETLISDSDYILISGNKYPKELVKSKLLKLRMSHIIYVIECMRKNTTKINNIRKYLLAALYNAPSTMDSYYQAAVNYDWYSDDARKKENDNYTGKSGVEIILE